MWFEKGDGEELGRVGEGPADKPLTASVIPLWDDGRRRGTNVRELGSLFLGRVPFTSSVTVCKALSLSEPLWFICRTGVTILTIGSFQDWYMNQMKGLRKLW